MSRYPAAPQPQDDWPRAFLSATPALQPQFNPRGICVRSCILQVLMVLCLPSLIDRPIGSIFSFRLTRAQGNRHLVSYRGNASFPRGSFPFQLSVFAVLLSTKSLAFSGYSNRTSPLGLPCERPTDNGATSMRMVSTLRLFCIPDHGPSAY